MAAICQESDLQSLWKHCGMIALQTFCAIENISLSYLYVDADYTVAVIVPYLYKK